jgi:uncharacterized integral membrane protein
MTSFQPQGGTDPSQVPPVTTVAPTEPKRRRKVPMRLIGMLVLLAIALWFVFANTADMRIKLWVTTVTAPTWLVLLCTLAAGLLFGWLTAVLRRRRAVRAIR